MHRHTKDISIIKKRIIYILMILIVLSSLSVSTFAETSETTPVSLTSEPAILSVTLPTSLPVNIDSQGNGGMDFTLLANLEICPKIINNSYGPIKITNAEISALDGWTAVDYTTANMKYEKVNAKKVAAIVRLIKLTKKGTKPSISNIKTLNNSSVYTVLAGSVPLNYINSDGELFYVMYGIKIPAQSIPLEGENILSVTFTVAWDALI